MSQLRNLIHNIRETLFPKALELLSEEEAVDSFSIIDLLIKELEEQKKLLHGRLTQLVSTRGVIDAKGHKNFSIAGAVLKHQLRVGKEPNEGAIMELLKENGIPVEDGFDRVSVLAYNPSKVANLVQRGLLDPAQIDRLRTRSYALLVEKSDRIVSAFTGEPEGSKARREST